MRNAFADELLTVAERDPRVVFLSGDIGNRLFDKFKAKYPDRFYNCGVAEQNMMGMAAGLAMCGLRPICYTITPFTTTRCLEQIRVDVCYHHVPVIIAGVGAGLCYAELGATHHACEDIAFLRMLPTMSVVCPGDPVEVIFPAVPGRIFTGKVNRVLPVIAEGQLLASGQLGSVTLPQLPGRVPVVIDLEPAELAPYKLPGGAAGEVVVYSGDFHLTALMRRMLLRMRSWENYLFAP